MPMTKGTNDWNEDWPSQLPRKKVFRGFNGIRTRGHFATSGYFAIKSRSQLKFSIFISFVFPQFTVISFCVSFLSRVDELNKLACLQCMGLHSSAGRGLQRERRGHGFESRWSPEKLSFGLLRNLLNYDHNCDHLYFRSSQFISKNTK